MPYLFKGEGPAPEPSTRNQPRKSKPKTQPQPENQQEDGIRMATDKQVAYIKSQLRGKVNQMDFLSTWAEEFTSFQEIPFHKVNDILSWDQGPIAIRERVNHGNQNYGSRPRDQMGNHRGKFV